MARSIASMLTAAASSKLGEMHRPSFTAHPCRAWSPDHVADHLRACRSGRDELDGTWRPWEELSPAERWAQFHEESVADGTAIRIGGPVDAVEVP